MSNSAYLLVVHGSRNSSYRKQLEQLQDLIVKGLDGNCLLTTAYLELGEKPLSDSIVEFSIECLKYNYQTLKIIPLFLFSGTHVLEDIPEEVNTAQKNVSITLELMPLMGGSKDLIDLLECKYQEYPDFERVLFCHGTRLEKGKEESKIIGEKLNAKVAYWSILPDLWTIIDNMVNSGVKKIVILPYFLFSGKIIDSIVQEIQRLRDYNKIELILLKPLGATVELAEVILKQIEN
ncbi:sirohydrochlorin chelatase [Geminocystis herdmanii]|uniref:sirohydrochlorin chelatase n=1 Tax=Geminocystis herdmanii TaxID=669359 RepID=UPI00034C5DC5|nr:CbiX/SirB N-terminal domain-containing protein [Geminocystis herdmanii]